MSELIFLIVLFQENNKWVVQCINYDIAAQGDTIEKAVNAFEKTFIGQIILDIENGKEPLEDTPKFLGI